MFNFISGKDLTRTDAERRTLRAWGTTQEAALEAQTPV